MAKLTNWIKPTELRFKEMKHNEFSRKFVQTKQLCL